MFLRFFRPTILSLSLILVLQACQQQSNNKTPDQAASDTATAVVKPLPPQEQKITNLAYVYKAGEVYRYRIDQEEKLVQDDSMSVLSSTVAYYTKTVKTVRDGITTFAVRYDSVRSKQTSKGLGPQAKDISFNSNDSADRKNPNYIMMSALVGEEVLVSIDGKGRVQEVSGMSGLIQHIATMAGKQLSEDQKSQLTEQIRQVYYAQLIQQEELTLPEGSLDSTMSWSLNAKGELPPVFVLSTALKSHVNSVGTLRNRKVAEIKSEVKGTIDVASPKIPVHVSKGTQNGEGTTIMDVEQGYIIQKHASFALELQASTVDPQTHQEQKIRQSKVTKLNVNLLR